jgi:hypothetical protein
MLHWLISIGIVVILAIPLTYATIRIIDGRNLEASVNGIVANRAVFGRPVNLVSTSANWTARPPIVEITLRTVRPLTLAEVQKAQDRLSRELHRPMHVVVRSLPLDVIDPNNPAGTPDRSITAE